MSLRFPTVAIGGLLALAALTHGTAPAAAATTTLTCAKAETSYLKPADGARSSLAVPMTVYSGCNGSGPVTLVLDPTASTRPATPPTFVRYCGSSVSPREAKTRTDVWSYCSTSLKATGDEGFWVIVK